MSTRTVCDGCGRQAWDTYGEEGWTQVLPFDCRYMPVARYGEVARYGQHYCPGCTPQLKEHKAT